MKLVKLYKQFQTGVDYLKKPTYDYELIRAIETSLMAFRLDKLSQTALELVKKTRKFSTFKFEGYQDAKMAEIDGRRYILSVYDDTPKRKVVYLATKYGDD